MTNEIKKIVKEVLDELTSRKTGNEQWSVELYLDYRDRELQEATVKMIAQAQDPRGLFYEITGEAFQESTWHEENELVKAVQKALNDAEMEVDADEIREYIQEHVDITVPTQEVLEHTPVCVNIIVDTGDANYEFTKNSFAHSYYGDGEGIEDESSLLWLAEQQGCSADDLKRAFREGSAFNADALKILRERDEVLAELESYGKRDAFGYEINKGQYAAAIKIKNDIDKWSKNIVNAKESYAKLPRTYEEYLELCQKRGNPSRISSAEKFAETLAEVTKSTEGRIQSFQELIDTAQKEIKAQNLEPVFEAIERYKEACGKVVELSHTEEYRKCRTLDSLVTCSSSTTSSMNALTFCVQMNLGEYLDLREAMAQEGSLNTSCYPEERKGQGEIVLSSKTHTILYDAWSGAGSCSDIELCSDVHIPIRLINSAYPDGIDGYGVKEIYGTNSDFFSNTLKEIIPMDKQEIARVSGKKACLDDKISSAEATRAAVHLESDLPTHNTNKEIQ